MMKIILPLLTISAFLLTGSFLSGCGGGSGGGAEPLSSSDVASSAVISPVSPSPPSTPSPPSPQQSSQRQLINEAFGILQMTFFFSDRLPSSPDPFTSIEELTNTLGDPFTRFVTPQGLERIRRDLEGRLVGIGITINLDRSSQTFMIVTVLRNSPASEGGLMAGDLILRIDGTSTEGLSLEEVASRIRGELNSQVTLTLQRGAVIFERSFIRQEVIIESVFGQILDPDANPRTNNTIGFLQQMTFSERTLPELLETLSAFHAENVQGILLDLRNNGGGSLSVAIEESDRFLASQIDPSRQLLFNSLGCSLLIDQDAVILRIFSRGGSQEICLADDFNFLTRSQFEPDERSLDFPIVILVNSQTASASEILTSALRENRENVQIVGEKTFGKGLIQNIFTLSDGSGLIITTREFRSPKRNQINKIGILPDIEVMNDQGSGIDRQFEAALIVLQSMIERGR
ncbi:MAG: PDZ domain-containing protein [Candidatus Tectomicrobia bacterium]|nr:PDZ domain-containing protein [Candidatus Tectomicrobia bacterium]